MSAPFNVGFAWKSNTIYAKAVMKGAAKVCVLQVVAWSASHQLSIVPIWVLVKIGVVFDWLLSFLGRIKQMWLSNACEIVGELVLLGWAGCGVTL